MFWLCMGIEVVIFTFILLLAMLKKNFKLINSSVADQKLDDKCPENVLLDVSKTLRIHNELCGLITEVDTCF